MQMDALTQAVFNAAYHSRQQHRRRLLFGALLGVKHTLRGLLFSWPLYLLSLAGLVLPGQYAWAFLLLLIPAVWVSVFILWKGWLEDYSSQIQGRLLKLQEWRRVLMGAGQL